MGLFDWLKRSPGDGRGKKDRPKPPTRTSATARMTDSAFHVEPGEPIDLEREDELSIIRKCFAELMARQLAFGATFGIDKLRWDVDQDRSELTFSDAGSPVLVCRIVILGSYAESSRTWLWSWANKHVDPKCKVGLEAVRELGRRRGFARWTDEACPADDQDCWNITGVAVKALGAKAAYRGPYPGGAVFLAILDVRRV